MQEFVCETPAQTGADGVSVPGTVRAVLEHNACHRPDGLAICDGTGGTAMTHRGLLGRVRAVSAALRAAGVRPADRVVVTPRGTVADVVILLALLGTTGCVPLDPSSTTEELLGAAGLVGATAVVADAERADVARSSGLAVVPAERLAATGAAAGDDDVVPHDGRGGGVDRRGPALYLATSGTSGERRIVALDESHVLAGARASARAYELGPGDRRLNVMPLFHVQGLVGAVLTALVAGSAVEQHAGFRPDDVLTALRTRPVTWFSATPTMHRLLLGRGPGGGPALRFVRCGSGALDPGLRREMRAFHGVPVVESYGMSEAHQIASTAVTDGSAAPPLMPTGSRIGVLLDGHVGTEPDVEGEIVVAGSNVSAAYLPPDPTCSVGEWFRTGDLGRLAADGSVRILGRLRTLIDRGGEKIAPREVEEALADHPSVAEAVVFGVPDPVFGERVAAAVVPRPGQRARESELQAHLLDRLAPHKVPTRIVVRAELPVNGTGKLRRVGLHELWAADLALAPEVDEVPGDGYESGVARLWERVLGGGAIRRDRNFFASGGDSLSTLRLLAMVQDEFSVRISPLDFYRHGFTVPAMVELIRRRAVAATE